MEARGILNYDLYAQVVSPCGDHSDGLGVAARVHQEHDLVVLGLSAEGEREREGGMNFINFNNLNVLTSSTCLLASKCQIIRAVRGLRRSDKRASLT